MHFWNNFIVRSSHIKTMNRLLICCSYRIPTSHYYLLPSKVFLILTTSLIFFFLDFFFLRMGNKYHLFKWYKDWTFITPWLYVCIFELVHWFPYVNLQLTLLLKKLNQWNWSLWARWKIQTLSIVCIFFHESNKM